ncbi:MAG: hypothetical protein HZC40_13385 [Chloroflexi bacterium]|nr:hypothetical protein [Chloroflexota bacterium]
MQTTWKFLFNESARVWSALVAFAFFIALIGMMQPIAHAQAPTPTLAVPPNPQTLKDPCALDPRNLVYNGSLGGAYNTKYGTVANGWTPFVLSKAIPGFRWVNNVQIDPNGSQQIFWGDKFDAGLYQQVPNLTPGATYWFRLGYSLATRFDGSDQRGNSIGRKVGVDPLGGIDPKSANVLWGADLMDGTVAVNRPEMTLTFVARARIATIFLRAFVQENLGGENRVWFDAVCMEARTDVAAATPTVAATKPAVATATRTVTSTAVVTPTAIVAITATPRVPTASASPTLAPTVPPPPTAASIPTSAPTRVAAIAPTPTPAPTSLAASLPAWIPIAIVVAIVLVIAVIALLILVYSRWRATQIRQGRDAKTIPILPGIASLPSFIIGLVIGFGIAMMISVAIFLLR